jgi:hypothetical protein
MSALQNLDRERFCQAAHRRIWAGERRAAALRAAYVETIYRGDDPDSPSIADNARKLANTLNVKARLAELSDYAAKLAGIDAGWAQLKLRAMVEANVHDYLTPADADGNRYFNVGAVSADKLAQLVELHQEEVTEIQKAQPARRIRKTKIKLPDKIAALGLMAKIAGWLAPEKQEHSGQVTLEQLIDQSIRHNFDPQSLKNLDEALAAVDAGKLTEDEAETLAIEKGWCEADDAEENIEEV